MFFLQITKNFISNFFSFFQLKDKNEREILSKSIFSPDKIETNPRDPKSSEAIKQVEQAKKSLEEQEILIRGYQMENEKLYAEIKLLKDETRKVSNKHEEEKQQLKFDLIQEKKLVHEKKEKNIVELKTHETNKFMPTIEQSKLKNVDIEYYEQQIRKLEQDLIRASSRSDSVASLNKELLVKAEHCERAQRQIETDIKVIESKNKEIKSLSEKLRLLEIGKTAPDFLKDLRQAKNQLKEMDLVVKRLRRPQANNSDSGVNISLDFYEKRIEKLEALLREKTSELDRVNCLFEQKSEPTTSSCVNIRKVVKLEPTNEANQARIEKLESVNSTLKNALRKVEFELVSKGEENLKLHAEIENLNQHQLLQSKPYEPNEFRNNFSTDSNLGDEFWKSMYAEAESLKVKLANAQNELKLREKEFELKQIHVKHANEKSFNELIRKHKYETNKLIGLLVGDELLGVKNLYDDGESLLDDPIRMRLILNSRTKHLNLTQTIEKQREIIRGLNEKLDFFKSKSQGKTLSETNVSVRDSASLEDVVTQYETQLKIKNKEIERFRLELDNMLHLLRTLQT